MKYLLLILLLSSCNYFKPSNLCSDKDCPGTIEWCVTAVHLDYVRGKPRLELLLKDANLRERLDACMRVNGYPYFSTMAMLEYGEQHGLRQQYAP
jgi:hypothetical protein